MATRDLLEYYTPSGATQAYIRYRGVGTPTTATNAHAWRIERYSYGQQADGTWKMTDRQVFESVAWDDRVTLPWAP